MTNDTWHEPSAWRHPDSRKKTDRKPVAPFVNEMPEIVLVCPCGRSWSNEACLTAHVERGCAVREEQK